MSLTGLLEDMTLSSDTDDEDVLAPVTPDRITKAASAPQPGIATNYKAGREAPTFLTITPRSKWVDDVDRTNCQCCRVPFTVKLRRHHCRVCGEVVCTNCTLRESIHGKLVRCCFECYKLFSDELPQEPPRGRLKARLGKSSNAKADKKKHVVRKILMCSEDAMSTDNVSHESRLLPDGRRALHIAAQRGYKDLVHSLLSMNASCSVRSNHGHTPLHCAARQDDEAILTMILESGGNIQDQDKFGVTPLHTAAEFSPVATKFLMNQPHCDVSFPTKDGAHALHFASKNLHDAHDSAELLLAAGANVNVIDNAGNTPVHYAAMAGNSEMIKYLVSKGANVNQPNAIGQTALHKSAKLGYIQSVSALLAAGCSMSQADNMGRTFFDLVVASRGLALAAAIDHLDIRKPAAFSTSPSPKMLSYVAPPSLSAMAGRPILPQLINKGMPQSLNLVNEDEHDLIQYRVISVGPGFYRINPAMGIIGPKSSVTVKVIMLLPESRTFAEVAKDRIIVQAFTVKSKLDIGKSFDRIWMRIEASRKTVIQYHVEAKVLDPFKKTVEPSNEVRSAQQDFDDL